MVTRKNTWQDAYSTGTALLDLGDGILVPLPTDGVLPGKEGPPGAGVPEGGAAGQVIRRNAAGTATEWASPDKAMVGLSNVDNTADADKPISADVAAALNAKADATALDAKANVTALDAALATQSNAIKQMPRQAPYLAHEDRLSGWRGALANQATAPAQVVVFGDSISEGTGTTTVLNRWINRAQAKLRYRYGVPSGAEFPFIPAVPRTTAAGFPVTRAGAYSVDSNYGLGWRTAILTGATGSVTFTFTGTSAKLMYFKGSGTGVAKITVDGGTPVVLDTNSTRNPPAGNGTNTWATGALTAGTHTVEVMWDSTSTQNVYVLGLITYNGDETSGIRFLDASYHGNSSAFLTAARNTQAANSLLAVGPVGLVVIAIETNDYGNGIAPATYKANLQAFITALRTGNSLYTGQIVLLNMYKSDARDEVLWNQYAQQMKDIAAADPKAAYFDLRLRMPDNPKPFNDPAGLGLFADSLHPNDIGSEWIATVMSDYLSLRSTPTLTTTKTASYTILSTDQTTYWLFNGDSLTATLPDPTTVPANAKLTVKNLNATALTVNSAGTSKTLDGVASQTLAQWAKATYVSDGAQWLTV